MQQLIIDRTLRKALVITWIFLILYLAISISAHANCNSDNIDHFLTAKKIKFIDISTNKSKKWTKNYFKAIQSSAKQRGKILKKFKKRYKAKITVLFYNKLSCIFPAKIRIHGDHNDHLDSIPPVTSLDVHLLKGNINSVIKFKLFIPHTRGSENEIFATALFKELGFLAPKTYNVPALFNGVETTFLYQEKITKEFIESNGLREAPILEGDERYMESNLTNKFVLTKVVNNKWISKGITSLLISQKALIQLNKTYLNYLLTNFVYKDPQGLLRPLKANSNNENAISKEIEFKSIMLAIGAYHGLSADDMRYYYDPIYQSFVPIYYDGDIVNIEAIKLNPNHTPSTYEVIGANTALASLKNIDKKSFQEKLNTLGLDYDLKKVGSILKNIKVNLESIASFSRNKLKKYPFKPYFSHYKKYNGDGRLVFTTIEKLRIEVCDFKLISCNFETITLKDYSKLLAAKYNDSYIFVGNKEEYMTGINNQEQTEKIQYNIGEKVKLISFGDAKILLDRKNKRAEIYQNHVNDRVLLKGGSLENWSIKFFGIKNNFGLLNKQRFNQKLLTGCITFLDMKVHNIEVDINGSSCEDGLNLIRVKGSLQNVFVKNVLSDAIDVDFSQLNFKTIKVNYAGNDCLDFSYGQYLIEKALLKDCKDKGISVGEKSKLTLNIGNITKANMGIASKDSSVIKVNDVTNNYVTTCFSAYNKKQEFWGGKIVVKKHNCKPKQVFKQANSLIEFIK